MMSGKRAVLGGLALLAAGCIGGVQITHDMAPEADFSGRRSFDWLESDLSYERVALEDSELARDIEMLVRERVVAGLRERGYRKIERGQPDFYVSYHIATFEQFMPRRDPDLIVRAPDELTRHDPPDLPGADIATEGTFVLYAYDGATQRYLWSGTAEGFARSPQEAMRKARSAVELVLEKFPPASP